jgi:hypothetical protein
VGLARDGRRFVVGVNKDDVNDGQDHCDRKAQCARLHLQMFVSLI